MIVATDGSPIANKAVGVAVDLVRSLRGSAQLHIVAVVDYPDMPIGLAKAPEGAPDLLADEAHAALEAATAMGVQAGIEPSVELLRGHVGAQILAYAERTAADVIVVGTHGRGGLARAILGSVCEHLVRHSPVPVLTVHA